MEVVWLNLVKSLSLYRYEDATTVVTTGEGKYYSTGANANWLSQLNLKEHVGFCQELCTLLARLLAFPLVTVAALNGNLT